MIWVITFKQDGYTHCWVFSNECEARQVNKDLLELRGINEVCLFKREVPVCQEN